MTSWGIPRRASPCRAVKPVRSIPHRTASDLPCPARDQRQELLLAHDLDVAHPAFQLAGQVGDVARLLRPVRGEHQEPLTAFRLAEASRSPAQQPRARLVLRVRAPGLFHQRLAVSGERNSTRMSSVSSAGYGVTLTLPANFSPLQCIELGDHVDRAAAAEQRDQVDRPMPGRGARRGSVDSRDGLRRGLRAPQPAGGDASAAHPADHRPGRRG